MSIKRPAHFLCIAILAALCGLSLFYHSRVWGAESPFDGYWRSENGSVVHISGDRGILVDAAVEGWKQFVNHTTIRNIRRRGNIWTADEWLMAGDDFIWTTATWRLAGNRIDRFFSLSGRLVESHFTKVEHAIPKQSQQPAAGATLPAARTSRHRFEAGALLFGFEYEEPSVMSENGYLYGISGRYVYKRDAVMIAGSLEYATGSLEYDGRTWGGTPLKADSDDHLLEARALLGGNLYQRGKGVTPYIGFGVRYWNNTVQAAGGYEREVLYLYSPVGIKLSGPISAGWAWAFQAEYDLFWKGWVTSHLSDADPGYNDTENHQSFGDGFGVRCAFQVERRLSAAFAWFIEPFFRYWEVDRSDDARLTYAGAPIGFVYEPENSTLTYGVAVGFVF